MKGNFNELFSKMKPEAQERVKARSSELLKEIALADLEDVRTPGADADATPSDKPG